MNAKLRKHGIADEYDQDNNLVTYHIIFDQNKLEKKKQKYLTDIINKISKDFAKKDNVDKAVLASGCTDKQLRDLRACVIDLYSEAEQHLFVKNSFDEKPWLVKNLIKTFGIVGNLITLPYMKFKTRLAKKLPQYENLEQALLKYERESI